MKDNEYTRNLLRDAEGCEYDPDADLGTEDVEGDNEFQVSIIEGDEKLLKENRELKKYILKLQLEIAGFKNLN